MMIWSLFSRELHFPGVAAEVQSFGCSCACPAASGSRAPTYWWFWIWIAPLTTTGYAVPLLLPSTKSQQGQFSFLLGSIRPDPSQHQVNGPK